MARNHRQEAHNQPSRPVVPSTDPQPVSAALSALVVSARVRLRTQLVELLPPEVEDVVIADNADEALACEHLADIAVIDAELGQAFELLTALKRTSPSLVAVIIADDLSLDDTVAAMRAGAVDVIPSDIPKAELVVRLAAASTRARRECTRDRRILRLKRLCRHLNDARQEVSGQVGSLCNDMVEAFRDISDQMDRVKTASELQCLLRQELEIESLLRTMLEFLLAKLGSTNAAIFLPATSGDYSLGAYVNYDRPRDTAEIMLDQLADSLAPRFESLTEVLALDDDESLDRWLGDDASWFEGSTMLAVACRHDGETLAVLTLFRNRSRPFSEADADLLALGSELFADQLARVIHIHHRHLPKDQWGGFDPDSDDFGDIDLAA